jgi:predicted transcriptional regulator
MAAEGTERKKVMVGKWDEQKATKGTKARAGQPEVSVLLAWTKADGVNERERKRVKNGSFVHGFRR